MSDVAFVEVGDRVFVLRHPVLDVNVTLVPGAEVAVVVDTLSSTAQGLALVEAARRITALPFVVVNTHHHFDHWLGNAAVVAEPPGTVWAHEVTATVLRERGDEVRRHAYREIPLENADLAAEISASTVLAPSHPVHREAEVDLGGRSVVLRHLGRGHTAGDLTVHVPDADVLVAGDLLEEGAPPQFDDGYPLEWPETVEALLGYASPATAIVPGHGAVLGVEAARGQHADLAATAWSIRDGHADGAPVDRVAGQVPFDRQTALVAVRRGYAELAGDG
ncbi:MBL fold metallo-hydrolase [Plantactinospora sp. GCM10030261]|uniref:MBL fold metallo-hydrolase n=1 Tax=Plantactinospora sp. GCM10030261 TaxID=3273420 RepID=UPI00360BFC32